MESNKNNSLTLTQKRIASAKGLHLVCAIVAMLLNIIAFVVLAVNVSMTEIMYLAFPLALAVLDIIFLIKVVFSNYRFSYAVNGAIWHSVIVLLVSVAAYAVMGTLEEQNGIVFVTLSMYAMLIVHVAQSIATLTTALYATKSKKGAAKIFGVLFTVVFLACAGIYGRMLLVDGFFGQGGYADYRTVVYKYNEQTQTYTASDVLDGYGTDVIIPHQFNGKHVAFVDCQLFAHEELTSVEVAWMDRDGCEEKLDFVGVEHLNFLNPELKLLAPRGYMDCFRKALYTLSEKNRYALDLANHVYPSDIKADEVYIAFGYDAETLALVGVENIIPVWIKAKGTEFNIKDHTNVSYIEHSDATSPAQLVWCHENQQEKIFKCIADENGNEIGGVIEESVVNAHVVFEKLYHLEIKADNEEADKTPIRDTHRYMWEGNEKIFDYVITTASGMQAKLDSLPKRTGFTLALKTASEGSGAKHEITDLASEIALLDASGLNTLVIYPEWTLKAPSIDTLTAGGVASGFEAVYGSDVALGSAASHENGNIALKYEWFYNGEKIADGNAHTIVNIYPNSASFAGVAKAGVYTLKVTAGQDDVTKLTSYAEKTIEVGFKKKPIDFVWTLPTGNDAIYSATSKNSIIEQTTFVTTDVINGDSIEYKITYQTPTGYADLDVKNAGTYALKLELLGNAAELYEIKADKVNSSVEIGPYTLDAQWDNTSGFIYVYDGTEKFPACTVVPFSGDVVNVTVGGKGIDYNKNGYTATATIDNANYVISESTKTQDFTIAKRPITITGWDNVSFIYNSKDQHPKVSGVQNLAEMHSIANIANDIIYDGKQTNVNTAGQYTVSVSLPEEYNYEFANTVTCYYDIIPAELRVDINDKEMTYNGKTYTETNQTGFTLTVTGLVGTDKQDEVFAITYGNAKDAIDYVDGGYTITATLNGTGKSKYYNYNITVSNGTLTIKKRPITVTINAVTKVYNGLPFTANDASFEVSGLAPTDTKAEVLDLNYKGDAIGAVNYSSIAYTIDADAIAGFKYGNYEVTIKKSTLTMQKAPLIITAVGSEKTYDGTPASKSEFSFNVEGLVNGETPDMLGTPSYSGAAVTQYNASTHKFSVIFPNNDVTNNYSIEYNEGSYVIHKKQIMVTVVSGLNKIYDGYTPALNSFDFTVDGLIPGETKNNLGTPKYTGAATTAVNAGIYQLSIDPNGFSGTTYARNYDIISVSGTFEITKRDITVQVVNGSMTYNGQKPQFGVSNFTITNLASTDRITDFGYEFSGAATENINVGTRELIVTLSDKITGGVASGIMSNYNIVSSTSGTYAITPRSLTIKVNDINKVYNGLPVASNEYSVQYIGIVDGDAEKLGNIKYSGTEATVNVGAYTIYATIENPTDVCDNYNISYINGYLGITHKKLVIAVQDASKIYDGTYNTPEFTVRPDDQYGLANGETLASLGEIVFGGSAKNAKDAGTYTISASFAATEAAYNNYDVSFTEGTYTIARKTLGVSVGNAHIVYSGEAYDVANLGFTANLADFISGETADVLGAPVYEIYNNGAAVNEARNAGNYTVSVSFPENGNYDISVTVGELTISPRQITVTPTAETRVSDGTAGGNFNYVIEGIDDVAEINNIREALGSYTFSDNVLEATAAGTYTFDVIFKYENSNYEITKNKGTFVITAPVTTGTTATTGTTVSTSAAT